MHEMNRLILLPVALAASIAYAPDGGAAGGDPPEPSFEVVHYRLDNGLEVVCSRARAAGTTAPPTTTAPTTSSRSRATSSS
jgi:hypothetical protein